MADSAVESWISELDNAIAESTNTGSSGALLVLRSALEERRGQATFTGYSIHQTADAIIPLPNWIPRPVARFAGQRNELRPVSELITEAIASPLDTHNLLGLAEYFRAMFLRRPLPPGACDKGTLPEGSVMGHHKRAGVIFGYCNSVA